MNPVVTFDGFEGNYVNTERLNKTVQLVPKYGSKSTSYGELLNALEDLGVPPDEVEGIYKVSSTDNSYSVQLRFEDTLEAIVAKQEFKVGGTHFDIMKLTEQIVTLRVHWLPLYFDNVILEEIFSEYGQVIDIKMMKTAHAKLVAQNGSREIRLKTDEFKKQTIPHLVKFKSGRSILVTMAGRPPYCLKCGNVGHVRARCVTRRAEYASVVQQRVVGSSADTAAPPAPMGVSMAASDEPAGTSDAPLPSNAGSEDSGSGGRDPPGQPSDLQQQEQQEMDLDPEKGQKRGRESQEGASEMPSESHSTGLGPWITPNRPAVKAARATPESEDDLSLSGNRFDPGDLSDMINALNNG